MKPLKLIVIGLVIFFASTMQAQVSINVNIGSRPAWGPVVESDVRYYYLPDVEVYYDMHTSMFIYLHGGRWIHRRHLPDRYCDYDLRRGRKVVVYDYRGDSPYTHCKYHKNRYRRDHDHERNIGERPGRGYYRNYAHDERRSHKDYSPGNGRNRGEGYVRNEHDHHHDHDNGRGKGRKD